MVEDPPCCGSFLDRGEDPPGTSARAREHLGDEHASQKVSPKQPPASGAPTADRCSPVELRNHLRERDRLTSESHAGFKARRETLRDEIVREVPLFGFYRDLLKWPFVSPDGPASRVRGALWWELRP